MADVDPPEPLFRAVKRRKIYKPRERSLSPVQTLSIPSRHSPPTSVDHAQLSIASQSPQPSNVDKNENDSADDLHTVFRRAKLLRRPRRGGIGFSNSSSRREALNPDSPGTTVALFERQNAVELAKQRFAPQTGQVAEVDDQHMMAYIDSELSRRSLAAQPFSELKDPDFSTTQTPSQQDGIKPANSHPTASERRQPATMGKLQEINLGPSASLRNIALTEAATRQLQGLPTDVKADDHAVSSQATKKPLLGRDGKPRRPPRRNRRNSNDILRDSIVEAVLRESKLDLYDTQPRPPTTSTPTQNHNPNTNPTTNQTQATNTANNDTATDDLLAEQFLQEYLETQQTRHQLSKKPPTNQHNSHNHGKAEDKSKGPKLGGSRSARAAMRAAEEMKAKGGSSGGVGKR